MYSLHLICNENDVDLLVAELWEAETAGIRELDSGNGSTKLIAGFVSNDSRESLLQRFAPFSPQWTHEADTDWIAATQEAWPGRVVGSRLFLATPWCEKPTPAGCLRVIHNPGLACGTGEHPCSQLALEALENLVGPGCSVADIGTGSGILAIAAHRLGASFVVGVDRDEEALRAATENFALNALHPNLVVGSADCLRSERFDLAVANISATVLLSIADDLLRIVRPEGALVLTGFAESESAVVRHAFTAETNVERDGWSCLSLRIS